MSHWEWDAPFVFKLSLYVANFIVVVLFLLFERLSSNCFTHPIWLCSDMKSCSRRLPPAKVLFQWWGRRLLVAGQGVYGASTSERGSKFRLLQVEWIHHLALPEATQAVIFIPHVIIECLGLFVVLLELAHLVELKEVVVFTGLEKLRILVVVVARVQTLFLRLELDPVLLVGLLLLLAKQQVHGHLQLVDFVDRNFCFRGFILRRFLTF